MSKNIKQMNKAELVSYAAEVGREDITDSMTKKEIILSLEEDGLDDVDESKPEPEVKSVPADDGDNKIVKMTREVIYYSYGKYIFTKDRKFVLMDSESADQITSSNPGDFVIATTKEVEDYYK